MLQQSRSANKMWVCLGYFLVLLAAACCLQPKQKAQCKIQVGQATGDLEKASVTLSTVNKELAFLNNEFEQGKLMLERSQIGLHLAKSQLDNVYKRLNTMKDQPVEPSKMNTSSCKLVQWLMNELQQFMNASGDIFYVSEISLNWMDAFDWCDARGMEMAMFKTNKELEVISKVLRERKLDQQYVWIAASDIGRSHGNTVWADGSQIDLNSWSPGEPNNIVAGLETCVNFSGYSARLYDSRCDVSLKFMCRVPKRHYKCPAV